MENKSSYYALICSGISFFTSVCFYQVTYHAQLIGNSHLNAIRSNIFIFSLIISGCENVHWWSSLTNFWSDWIYGTGSVHWDSSLNGHLQTRRLGMSILGDWRQWCARLVLSVAYSDWLVKWAFQAFAHFVCSLIVHSPASQECTLLDNVSDISNIWKDITCSLNIAS